jgi:DNA-binding transcriptional ArsR family regulator
MEEAVQAAAAGRENVVAYFGSYSPPEGLARWQSGYRGARVRQLLDLPEYKVAQVLAVLGSEVRLGILRSLLHSPKSAAELVAELGLGNTGRAYHHLRELEKAGYLEQREGRYRFVMPFVEVYLTALALSANALRWAPNEAERFDENPPDIGNDG